MKQKVFINRILNMKHIKYIGLDMDHTLVRYHTKQFEALVYQLVIDKLITRKHYPKSIKKLEFKFSDAIRGLVIDTLKGNILKLSRYGAIRHSAHGTKAISYENQRKIYGSTYIDIGSPNYIAVDTSFSISFCVLYAQLVDLKDSCPEQFPDYEEIAFDVLKMVDKVHADGSLKKKIAQDLDKYVIKDKKLVEGLKRYQRLGKKIFILTNSDFYYTRLLLDYAIDPFLGENESWVDLFEYIITFAGKPRFFVDNLKFLKIDFETGLMSNVQGKITPGIYQGGSANQFTEDLELNGDEILYVGDHIYGDILRLKKDCNWRTALVVEELGQEIASQIQAQPVEKQIVELMDEKKGLEQKNVALITQSIEQSSKEFDVQTNILQHKISELDEKIAALIYQQKNYFNKKWDRVFRAGAEESYFAYQVNRFACIYMEKLTDLLEQSPFTYFRANRRLLAHDMEVAD